MLTGPPLGASAASPSLHRRRSLTLPSSLRRTKSQGRSESAPPPSPNLFFSPSTPGSFTHRPDDAVVSLVGSIAWKLLSWAAVLLRFVIPLFMKIVGFVAVAIPTVFLAITYLKIAARLRAVDEHAAFLLLNILALQQLRSALFGRAVKGVNRAVRRIIAGTLAGVFAGGAWSEASLVYGAGSQVIGIETHLWLLMMVAGMVEAGRYALEI